MPDTIFPESNGMDNSNLDINQGLQNNQNTIGNDGSSFNTDFNVGRTRPSFVSPSVLQTPDLNSGGGSSFEDDLKNAFASEKPTGEADNHVFRSELPTEAFAGRYPTYYNTMNNEDLAAKKQGTLSRIANGVAKTVGTAGITFAQGIVAPIYGSFKGIQEGSFSAIYDNDAMRALDAASKKMENVLPSYVSDKEKNTPWYMPTSDGLFSANFVFDKGLKMVGFMGGMAASAWALGGVGSAIADAMPIFGKVAASGKLVESLADAERVVSEVPEAQRFATWTQKLADLEKKAAAGSTGAAFQYDMMNKAQRLVASTFASAGISASMSLETMNAIRENLKRDFIQKNNYEPGEEDMAQIDAIAKSAGNTMFGLSSLISAYSFHGALGKIMGSFTKNETKVLADQVVLKQGEKELASGLQSAGKVGTKIIGADGTVTMQGAEEATMYAAKAETPSWYDQSAFGSSTVGKTLKKAGHVWSPKAAFGMAEFNTLTPGVESYYDKKYHGENTDVFDDFIVPGVKNIFTAEGLESAFLGGLVGARFEAGERKGERQAHEAHRAGLTTLADSLNSAMAESYLKSQVDHYKRASAIAEQASGLSPDNVIDRKDSNFQYLHNYLFERIKHGLSSMVKSDLTQYKELASTPEGLQQLKDDGIIHKDITKDEFIAHLDNIQRVADRMSAKYENLQSKYGSMVNRAGDKIYPQDVIEKLLYAHEKVDDYTERIASLSNKVIKEHKIDVVPLLTALDKGQGVKEQAIIIEDRISKMFVTDEEKENLKRDVGDIARLHNRKKATISEYNDMKKAPFDYADKVKENIITTPTTQVPGVPIATIPLIHGNSKVGTDGKVEPSNIEIGTEYTAGGIESPAEYQGKISSVKEFAKFKVLGEAYKNPDGSITSSPMLDINGKPLKDSKKVIQISYDNGKKTTYKDPAVFKNLLLTKTSDLAANTEAQFYVDHANDIFTYQFSRDGETKKGRLWYDKKTDSLMFKYRGNDGKIYNKELSLEDFTKPRAGEDTPRLQFLDSQTKISPEEYARLKAYNDPTRQAKAERQLEIVNKVLVERKTKLQELKDKVKDHEEFLNDLKENMNKLKQKIETHGVTKKNVKRYLTELNDMQDFHNQLQGELVDAQTEKEELQNHVDSLEDSIANLSSLPDGLGLIDHLKKGAEALQDRIKNNDTIIDQLNGIIGKVRNFISRLTSSLVQKIARFDAKYPSDVPDSIQTMDQSTANTLLTILKANEYNLGKTESGLTTNGLWNETQIGNQTPTQLSEQSQSIKEFLETHKDYLADRDNILDTIHTLEVRKSEVDSHLKQIEAIQEDTKKLQKELDLQKDIINAFEAEYRTWRDEVLMTNAFENSKGVKTVLKYVQNEFNNQSTPGGFGPTSPEDPEVKKLIDQTPFSAKKSVADRGLATSIIVDDTNKNTPFYQRNNKWAEREREFTSKYAQTDFVPKAGNIEALKGEKLSADNVKVVTIHRDNQDNHGFGSFIEDSYTDVHGDLIHNTGDKRNDSRAAVALVYVYDHEGALYTMDKDGNLLSEVSKDAKQDPDNFVFTYLDNSLLKRTGKYEPGKDKFYDAEQFTPQELDEIEALYTKERTDILNSKVIYPEKFQLSSGKLNVTKDAQGRIQVRNNSVVDVNIIDKDELTNPQIVSVATLEDPERKGFANIGGKLVPLGLAYVNTKTGPVIVNTRRLNEKDAINIFNIIKKITKGMFDTFSNTTSNNPEEGSKARVMLDADKKTQAELKKYLRNVLFFRTPMEGKPLGRNQIFINDSGELVIGKKPIKLSLRNLEDPNTRQDIITLLKGIDASNPGIFHNVNQWTLNNEPGVFTELRVDNDGNIERIHWKNYQSYLLSSKYELDSKSYSDEENSNFKKYDGKERNSGTAENFIPLTVNAIKPTAPGETAIVNRYITVSGIGERITPKPKEVVKPAEVKIVGSEEYAKSLPADKTVNIPVPETKTVPVEHPIQSQIFKAGQSFIIDGKPHIYENARSTAEKPIGMTFIISENNGKVDVKFDDLTERGIEEGEFPEDFIIAHDRIRELVRKEIEQSIQQKELDKTKTTSDGKIEKTNDEVAYPEEAAKSTEQRRKESLLENDDTNSGYSQFGSGEWVGYTYDNKGYEYEIISDSKEQLFNLINSFYDKEVIHDSEAQQPPNQKIQQIQSPTEALTQSESEQAKAALLAQYNTETAITPTKGLPKRPNTAENTIGITPNNWIVPTLGDSTNNFVVPTSQTPTKKLRAKFSEGTVTANVHGIASEIFKDLRVAEGGILDAIAGKKSFDDLINPVKNMFTQYFQARNLDGTPFDPNTEYTVWHPGETTFTPAEKTSLFDNWNNVLNNWETYKEEIRNFLKSRKISFAPEGEKDKAIVENESRDLTPREDDNYDLSSDHKEEVTEKGINYNNRDYGIDILKLDAKKNAPIEIKILFDAITHDGFVEGDGVSAKLAKKLNSYNPDLILPTVQLSHTGMDRLVGNDTMFYKVMGEMVGAYGLPEMEKRFKKLAMKHPSLVRPYKALFDTPPGQRTVAQWRMAMLFEKAFTKQKPDYVIHRIDENGNSYSFNANEETDVKQIVSDFINTAISKHGKSDLIKLDEYGNYQFNLGNEKPEDDYKFKNVPSKDPVAFLSEIGYNFPQEIFDKLTSTQQKELGVEAERLKSQLPNLKTKGGKLVTVDSLDTDAVRNIADLYVSGEGVFKSSQHLNISNEPVQNYILPNNFSMLLNKLSQVHNLADLKTVFPRYNDVFARHSLLLSNEGYIFGDKGEVVYRITPTITEGLVTKDDRTINADMNLGVRFIQGFNMNLGSKGQGNFYNLIPADSKSEWGAQIKHYISLSDFTSVRYNEKVRGIFKNYLTDEIDMIKDFNDNPNRSKFEQLSKEVGGTGEKIGQRLRFFKGILNEALVKDIHDYANGRRGDVDLINTEDYIKTIEPRFNADLAIFLEKQVKETRGFLEDNRIVDPREDGYNFKGLNSTFISDIATHNEGGFRATDAHDKPLFTSSEVDDIVGFRNINLLIHNIELHKVWVGDPAMYKDETKRIKLFLSGKEFTHTDGENVQGINYSLNQNVNKVGDHSLKPGQLGYHNFSDILPILTYDHNDSLGTTQVSPAINQYIEVLGKDRGEKYAEINGIDAQSHMSLPYYREHKMKTGIWTDAQEEQYQYDMVVMRKEATDRFNAGESKFAKFAYDSNNKDDMALQAASEEILTKGNPNTIASFYIDKPLGSGIYANSDLMTPFALKTSTFALSWESVRGRHLEDLYLKMLENNVGYAGPKSQHKVGTLADTPPLYDKKTGLIGLTNDSINEAKQSISWEDFGKIVETVSTHTKTTLGSQLTKQDTLNLFDSGLPKDFFKPGDHLEKKLNEWAGLTEAEKQEKSKYYKWFSVKNQSLEALADKGTEDLFESLGIHSEDGTHTLIDPEKLVGFLSQEINRRELPENMKDALDVWFNPDSRKMELANALETLSNFNQLKSIINSTIDTNINKPKVNGGQRILVSAAGFDKGPMKLMAKTKDGWATITSEQYEKMTPENQSKCRLFSESLKSYTRVEQDGKQVVTRMQVYLPSIFHDKLKKARIKLSDEELYDYLNTAEGKKLLYGIGFRIPTQGQNSIDSFEIVPFDAENKRFFMPSTHGDCIVVPAELATKVGSDFDVDKLNCYFKNFYVDKKGYPRVIEFIEDTNNRDNLTQLYARKYGHILKKLSKFETLDLYNLDEKMMSSIFGQPIEGQIPSYEEFVSKHMGGNPFELNTRKAVENRYFDNLHEIVTNPDSFEQLIAPNDAQEMKDYETLVNDAKQRDLPAVEKAALQSTKLAKNDLNYINLTDPIKLAEERQNFMEAKSQVGIAASNNSSNAIAQTSFVKLYDNIKLSEQDKDIIGDNDLKVKLPHNQFHMKVNGQDELVSILSGGMVSGKYISDKLSQVIDGTVDAAKDPWLMRLFPSQQALSTALFLTRLGTPMDSIVLFLHQPSVLRFIKEQNINVTLKNLDPNFDTKELQPTMVLANVREQFKIPAYAPREANKPFTVPELSAMISKFGSGKEFTSAELATQGQILDEFMKYNIFGTHLFKVQQGMHWDTLSQPSASSVFLKETQLVESMRNNIIDNTVNMMKNNFIANRRSNIQEVMKAFSTIFKSSTEQFQTHILPIWEAYATGKVRVASDVKRQIMDKAQTSFLNFLTQNFYKVNGKSINTGIESLAFSDTFMNTLNAAKAINKEGTPKYNMALDNLRVEYNVYSKDIKNVTLSEKPKDKYAADALTESFKQLKESHPDLYRNLVILSHLQYGITDSRLSINKYIPVEDYLVAIKSGLSKVDAGGPELQAFNDTNQFYKNNWNNEDTVPTLKSYFNDETMQTETPGKYYFNGLHNPVILLKSKSRNGAYPAVKVKSSINPETGLDYTLADKANLKLKGFGFKKTVELYRRIEDGQGTPVITEDGYYIYRQINALGDGNNLQEYYTDNRPSVRKMHFHVDEEPDLRVLDYMNKNVTPDKDISEKNTTFADSKEQILKDLINNKEVKRKDC